MPYDSMPNSLLLETERSAAFSWRSASGETLHATAEVETIMQDGIVLLAPAPITVGQTVYLNWSGAERRAEVHHCEKRANAYLLILRFILYERRRADRLSSAGTGTLQWSMPGGARQAARVSVRNIGASGALIVSDQPLVVDQMVRLSGETWECIGRIRYCRRDGKKFLSGIQLTQPPQPKGSRGY